MGGLSGPVKAAHHNRAGMGGQHYQGRGSGVASGSQPHGSLDDSRQSPQHSNQGNNQSFAVPHNQGAGANQGNDLDSSFNQNNQRSSPINKVGKGNNNLHLSTIQSKPAHHVSPSSAASHAGPSQGGANSGAGNQGTSSVSPKSNSSNHGGARSRSRPRGQR